MYRPESGKFLESNHISRQGPWLACVGKHRFLFATLVICVFWVGAICFFPVLQIPAIIKEGGVIESLTAIGWFAAAMIVVFKHYPQHWALAGLFLAAVARELDLHQSFTADSILKLKYWLSISTPPAEKPLAAMILLILLACGIAVLRHYGRAGWAAVRKGDVIAIQVLCALILLGVAKLFLDGMSRKLSSLGIHLNEHAYTVAGIWEECLELTAVVLVLGALWFGCVSDENAR